MNRQRRRLPALAVLALILAGCAGMPMAGQAPATAPWAMRQATLGALRDWELGGRISLAREAKGWHANLQWQQQGSGYSIALVGPLGQGRLEIEGGANGARLRNSDGQVIDATDPDALVEKAVGWRIPIKGLVYWVRGLPEPGVAATLEGDGQGRLTRLRQSGWIIDYLRYEPVEGIDLPARIDARQGDLEVKLVIGQWRLPS
ncbi:MAG TPA: lipoprotein insertase outer membrane protein LolB [Candidatus Competibacteraceae bacterium]|nr:lipoprotein insertase outer membrane protein LolB [Candidatus Competibacteraceae bacterium]